MRRVFLLHSCVICRSMADKGASNMRDDQKGVLAIIAACTVWGLSPLYYAQVSHVSPLEVLSYRGLWSLAFFTLILAIQGRLSEVRQALAKPRQMLIILAGSVMIAANWFGFIYGPRA